MKVSAALKRNACTRQFIQICSKCAPVFDAPKDPQVQQMWGVLGNQAVRSLQDSLTLHRFYQSGARNELAPVRPVAICNPNIDIGAKEVLKLM
jgi:hypothetical protein